MEFRMLLILTRLIFQKTICIELVEQEEQSVKDEQFYFQKRSGVRKYFVKQTNARGIR